MDFDSLESVSYTHLDVYKRQIINFSIGNNAKGKYVIKNTNDKISVIDEKKAIILPPTNAYDSIKVSADYEEIAIFKNGKMGLFTNMKELIPPVYDRITLKSNYSYEIVKDGMKAVSYTHLDVYKRQG